MFHTYRWAAPEYLRQRTPRYRITFDADAIIVFEADIAPDMPLCTPLIAAFYEYHNTPDVYALLRRWSAHYAAITYAVYHYADTRAFDYYAAAIRHYNAIVWPEH